MKDADRIGSAIRKFRRYKELRRIMGKEDRIVMDIEEIERNLKIWKGRG
ncbi:MAG: hypothetical protein ACXQTS_00975 [Candidatus Methanospirareceae archaeon]